MVDFFTHIFPNFVPTEYSGSVDVVEHADNAKVNKVTWTDSTFQHFTHDLAKKMSSVFDSAKSDEFFKHDCDGITIFEESGKTYIFLTELKSSFSTQALFKAKKQVVASFIKLNMLLQLSRTYRIEDCIVKGFICGFPPKSDFLVNLSSASELKKENEKYMEYDLTRKLFLPKSNSSVHSCTLNSSELYCLKDFPLGERGIFDKFELYYIDIPKSQNSVTLNVHTFI